MDDSRLLEQFKALSDPIRWTIVQELRAGTRCACQLSQLAEISPALLSYHVSILRDAGLISGARRGRWTDFTLDVAALDRLAATIAPRSEVPT